MSQPSESGFPSDNQYKLGQLVCLKKTGVMYHVVGIGLYLGYDCCLWVYSLAKPTYGESTADSGPWRYSRTDVDMVKDVKEIDLMSAEDAYSVRQEELKKKIEFAERELEALRAKVIEKASDRQ